MVMRWLIQEWIAQWLGLRDRLRTGREPDAWWLGVRERILRFLVARYVENESNPDAPRDDDRPADQPPPLPIEARRTFCRVRPEDHPPRKCVEMSDRLRSVSRINEGKGARWRWF